MSQEWIIYLVLALIFLVIVLVGVLLFLGYKILKSQGAVFQSDHRDRLKDLSPKSELAQTKSVSQAAPLNISNDISKDSNKIEILPEAPKHYCFHHPSDHAAGVCAICQNAFCDECIKEHDGLSFCEDHFRLYLSHDWDELDTIKTNPDIPESALPLYDFKKSIWELKKTPSILSTHYRINIEGDFIESYVKLVVRKEELDLLKNQYQKLKQ
ncbi:MAG: hypothetical protein CME63_05495 [Halobacteriovoraceae bacterium]|nr:hypothetical protein [Halobacteriovoraceae bacterium]